MIRGFFHPFCRTLLLETDSPAILAMARESFGRFGGDGIVLPGEPDVVLRLFADGPADGELSAPEFRDEGSLLVQSAGRAAFLVADPERGAARGSFSPAALEHPAFFRSHFLHFAFLSMLAPRGLMAVHGSALVKDGRAVLLRGPSGSGKTTLAYAGARSRFRALAEDVVWVEAETGVWRGMPWHFHLLPDAARLFPEVEGLPATLESAGKMKLEVDLEAVRRGSTAVEARPGPVVLLERRDGAGGSHSDLEPLDLRAALDAWHRCPAGLEERFPGYRRHVEALLGRGAWRLRAGTDLDGALDLLESLFE